MIGNVDMSPADRQFQPRPKAFHAVDVGVAFNELFRAVIDRLVVKADFVQSLVGAQFVSVYGCALLDILRNDRLQGTLFDIGDDLRHDFTAAFQHPENDRLVRGTATTFATAPATADIGLIRFYMAVKDVFTIHVSHVLPDFMRHAPCTLVRYAKLTLQLFSRYAMPGSRKQVNGKEPLVQRGTATLHWSPYAGADLITAPLAVVNTAG